MTLTDLFNSSLIFVQSFFNAINSGFKFLFNDTPALFGLKLGWWFLLFSILGLIISRITGEDSDD